MSQIHKDGTLTESQTVLIQTAIELLAAAVHNRAVDKGWWTDPQMHPNDKRIHLRNFGELIAPIHSELSEALEAWRDHDDPTKLAVNEQDKPIGVASELADVIIRVLDMCMAFGIPIAEALTAKHAYNGSRPHRHGGKLA